MDQIFGHLSFGSALVALVCGTGLGSIYGLIPGIGGRVGLILSIPLASFFDPYAAAIFLFATHAVIHTSSSIPSIAFGLPSSGADMATVQDGYPLARMGRAGEALGAALSASAIGGVLGALGFLLAIPIAKPLVTSFGPPEMLMLALFSITMVSSISTEGMLQGLIVAIVGVIFAMVGLDARTGGARFTFGLVQLWDGLDIPALICGLFVIPEMLSLRRTSDEEAHERAIGTTVGDVMRGMAVSFRHKAVLLRSTLYGILAGVTPAVGASVGVWMAYGYAARTTKSDVPFGKGAVAGVIAPEAANNSKEGGAMIPTLFFAIPGSSAMAIMMGALAFAGIQVGPNMLGKDIGLSYALAAAVAAANIIAIPFFFAAVPWIVRLSALRREMLVPVAIALSVTAALINSPTIATQGQLVVAGILGVALKAANWPRAPFILGFVVAKMAESAYFVTAAVWGWSALQRPITALLLIATLGWLGFSVARRPALKLSGSRLSTLTVGGALLAFFIAVVLASRSISPPGGIAPGALAAAAGVLCLFVLGAALKSSENPPSAERLCHVDLTAAFLLLTPLVGLFVASLAYVAGMLRRDGVRTKTALVAGAVLAVVQIAVLSRVFDVLVEKEIIGRIAWTILGY